MNAPVPNQRKKPRTRIQAINRNIILDAALDAFSSYGYRGATIDQIAEKAGMSKPNLLYYFRRKEDIYRAVLEATLATWLEPLEHLDAGGDPIEEIAKYIRLKLRMARDMPRESRLFSNEILHGAPAIGEFLRGPLKDLVDAKAKVIRRWVDEGRITPVDPVHLIFMIWATTQHYADFDVQVRAVLGEAADDKAGDGDPTLAAEKTLLTIFCDGLRPR
ncbi:TetR family transcriptional regulator C-terminal domain-containing protein [Microbaculum marinisediminis]|uniref:TetR family transcriptional regulator C-terminal domain-containing protein n=1 Tax=Microbaculum marinisediminis TaxID=2931392 RepID=A0AAW5QWD3_9HYPH|nr:TetR family transcriptional regulator C-terminal domain-containing protein [Microbaculum sp. A6E488]MCT8971307.1 TetR family transcriptional regulator C-terminal domain-containing protein [Microbaculum sp. A6E488]